MALTREQQKAMFANLRNQDLSTLAIRLQAKDIDPELRMKINEEVRRRELKEKKAQEEFFTKERANVEFRNPELAKDLDGFIRSGTWEGIDKDYADYERVKFKGRTYDTKTEYLWENPDFPDAEQFDEALEEAEKVNPRDPSPSDFLDYSEALFRFKLSGIRVTEDGTVEALPKDSPLGRIPVEDLEVAK